jgi:hypothetical protein
MLIGSPSSCYLAHCTQHTVSGGGGFGLKVWMGWSETIRACMGTRTPWTVRAGGASCSHLRKLHLLSSVAIQLEKTHRTHHSPGREIRAVHQGRSGDSGTVIRVS